MRHHIFDRFSEIAIPAAGTVATGGATFLGYTMREVNEYLQAGAYAVSIVVGITTVAYTLYKWYKGHHK